MSSNVNSSIIDQLHRSLATGPFSFAYAKGAFLIKKNCFTMSQQYRPENVKKVVTLHCIIIQLVLPMSSSEDGRKCMLPFHFNFSPNFEDIHVNNDDDYINI